MKHTSDLVFPEYREFELKLLIPTIKISMIVGILFILLFIYPDIVQHPNQVALIITVRILACIPLLIVYLVLNSNKLKYKMVTIILPFAYIALFIYIFLHTQIPGKIYFFNIAWVYSLLIVISVSSLYSRFEIGFALIISMLISFGIMYYFSTGNEEFLTRLFLRSLGPLIFTFILAYSTQTNRKKNYLSAKTIHKQTLFDPLTQIYNRRGLDVWLSHKVEPIEKFEENISLIMFDIDNFKKYNDEYGHQIGDSVLEGTAKLMLENTQEKSCIVRFGGDEFIVILLGLTHEQSIKYAKSIKNKIEQHTYNIHPDKPFGVTVSAGITHAEEKTNQQIEELISIADSFAYKAKLEGKNKVVWE